MGYLRVKVTYKGGTARSSIKVVGWYGDQWYHTKCTNTAYTDSSGIATLEVNDDKPLKSITVDGVTHNGTWYAGSSTSFVVDRW